MNTADVDTCLAAFSDDFNYADHRRLSGDPVVGLDAMRRAIIRIFQQYNHFEWRTLAVRGDRLMLSLSRWSDDDGNETTTLYVAETGDDGRIVYQGRFDEDDFEGAYRELERRYFAGEGAAMAEAVSLFTDWTIAANDADFDRVFGALSSPDLRVENRSRSAFPERSAAQYRVTLEELAAMVASARSWGSAMCAVSPTVSVVRTEREAIGFNGEHYSWSWLLVLEVRDGRLARMCLFEPEDEDNAFAYAEERVRASTTGRLAVTNRAVRTAEIVRRAANSGDVDGIVDNYAEPVAYDDRRRLTGDPIVGANAMRAATDRILQQYSKFEQRALAVRGESVHLTLSRWSDDSGNETSHLHVQEVDGEGRIVYDGRFDEDDFEGAYRELERRYYAGEGAAFAENGASSCEFTIAANRRDYDRVFGDIASPDLRVENRSRSAFPVRSAEQFRAGLEELDGMFASVRTWASATVWQSPTCSVARIERTAAGRDGEIYEWTRIFVVEYVRGRVGSICEFEIDDEENAFAYAEERMRATARRLAVTNRSCDAARALHTAMQAGDAVGCVNCLSDRIVYDDRRRLSGDPIATTAEFRAAFERILQQYSRFEFRTLAVRGERLNLNQSYWSDEAGNQTAYLHLYEIGDDGLQVYEGRFDEGDFEGAYRELENRYYAGEGLAFTEAGKVATDYIVAYNLGDFDRLLGELTDPEMRFESRSRSVFGDRSIAEFRTSIEELSAMVASSRTWYSVVRWLSPTWCVCRFEREAVGVDGEQFRWARNYVTEIRDGRVTLSCQFELDDEDAAFAYAEERMRAATSQLTVTNRASDMDDT